MPGGPLRDDRKDTVSSELVTIVETECAQRARGEPILFNSVKCPTQLLWCPHLSSAVVEQQRLVETSSTRVSMCEFVECTHIEWAPPFLEKQMFRSGGTSTTRSTSQVGQQREIQQVNVFFYQI